MVISGYPHAVTEHGVEEAAREQALAGPAALLGRWVYLYVPRALPRQTHGMLIETIFVCLSGHLIGLGVLLRGMFLVKTFVF